MPAWLRFHCWSLRLPLHPDLRPCRFGKKQLEKQIALFAERESTLQKLVVHLLLSPFHVKLPLRWSRI